MKNTKKKMGKGIINSNKAVTELLGDLTSDLTGMSTEQEDRLHLRPVNSIYDELDGLGVKTNVDKSITDIDDKTMLRGDKTRIGDITYDLLRDSAMLMSGNYFDDASRMTKRKLDENNFILNHMPKLMTAILNIVNEIISPDVVTDRDNIFPLKCKQGDLTKEQMSNVASMHDLDELLERTYINACLQGKEHLLVIPQKEIFRRLYEDKQVQSRMGATHLMLEADVNDVTTDNDICELIKTIVKVESPDENRTPLIESVITANSVNKKDEDYIVETQYNLHGSPTYNANNEGAKIDSINKNLGDTPDDKIAKLETTFKHAGAYCTRLAPDRLYPFDINGRTLGYYYVEECVLNASDNMRRGFLINNIIGRDSKLGSSDSRAEEKYDKDMLLDNLTKMFAKTINPAFIRNNKELMPVITDIVYNATLTSTGVQVRFIPTKYVETFMINNGVSMLALARIPAKMYILTRWKQMMGTLHDDDDKYVVKVPVGGNSNLYAKSMKAVKHFSRVFSSPADITELDRGFTRMSSFNKMIVPVDRDSNYEGYEVTRLEGGNRDLSALTDRMKNLEDEALALLDRPADIMESMNNVDFATRLAAMNQNAAVKTAKHQKHLKKSTCSFLTKLFSYELGEDIIMDCPLSPPRALKNSMTQEELDESLSLADKIVEVMASEEDDGLSDSARVTFKKEVIKKITPQVQWDEYEEMLSVIRIKDNIREKIKKDDNKSE